MCTRVHASKFYFHEIVFGRKRRKVGKRRQNDDFRKLDEPKALPRGPLVGCDPLTLFCSIYVRFFFFSFIQQTCPDSPFCVRHCFRSDMRMTRNQLLKVAVAECSRQRGETVTKTPGDKEELGKFESQRRSSGSEQNK